MTNKNKDGFEEVKKIDMRIYNADASDAKWFKTWCDRQGINFNAGLKIMRRIVEEQTILTGLGRDLEGAKKDIDELYNILQEKGILSKKEDFKDSVPTFGKKKNGN